MTGNRSIFRFLMTLVFAVLIASPQPMVASELSDNAGSEGSTEVTSSLGVDNTGDNPGDPGGDDTTGGDGTTEGQAPEGEGNPEDGNPDEGNPEERRLDEGNSNGQNLTESMGGMSILPSSVEYYICHALGTVGEFERISPNEAGVYNGHLGQHHQEGRDIIPPFSYDGVEYSQNWDDAGQAIWGNDCVQPNVPTYPAYPTYPAFTASVCEDGVVIMPTMTPPANTDAITYGETIIVADNEYGRIFRLHAYANDGFTFEGASLPGGWRMLSATEARFDTTRSIAECEPAVLAAPGVVLSVCEDGVVERPNLIAPEDSESVTYGEVRHIADSLPYGAVFHITATANPGFTFDGVDLGPGWHYVSPTEAEFRTTRPIAECLPAELAAPGVVASVCVDGVVERPNLIAPEDSESVTYGEVRFIADSLPYGAVFHITATANEGYTFENVNLGPGWHYVSPTEAEFRTTRPIADCDPAMPMMPVITESVCQGYDVVPPSVEVPEDTDVITYGELETVEGDGNFTFTFTATIGDGYTFEGVEMPDGWTMVSPTEAVFEITLDLVDCGVAPTVVAPELPTLVAAVCGDDDAGETVLPYLVAPETEGVTYGEVTVGPANSVLLSLTATANEGYTFAGAELPEGWTLISDTEAVYEIVADTVECPVEEKEKPKKEKAAPEVKELPSTGVGSNPAPLVGIAATAAAAIAGAGIFFTNRKR